MFEEMKYIAGQFCNGLDCVVTLAGLNSTNGDYKWHILDYLAYGYSTWSEYTNFTLSQ
jgi:diaminopimelate decarboxylase